MSAGTKKLDPIVYQVPLPEDIQNRLCIHTNKYEDITMIDLELSVDVLRFLVLGHIKRSLTFAQVEIFVTPRQVYNKHTSYASASLF